MANRRGKDGSSDRFCLLGLQNHCGRRLQPQNQKMIASWEESYDRPRQCVEKQRHYSVVVFPVVTFGCESWTVKKAEHHRIHAFDAWGAREDSWESAGRSNQQGDQTPWIAKISNQLILREINPEYLLEGLILELRFQYFGHLMQTADSLEKSLMLGKIEGSRRRGCQRMRLLDGITHAMIMNLGKLQEMMRDREACHAVVHGVTKSQIGLSDWITMRYSHKLIWSYFAKMKLQYLNWSRITWK